MNDSVRDILDKVKEKSAAAAGYVGKKASHAGRKTSELWEITRLRMQIYDLNGELNTTYKKIGELVYAAHVDPETDTDAIDDLLEQAENKLSEINTRREKIISLKHTEHCPNPECGRPVDKEDTYCRVCGAAILTGDDET